jgi:hypothetical protein
MLFNYYAALKLRKNEKIRASALVFSGIAVGGLTVTNIVKVYTPLLFEEKVFKNWRKFGNLVLRVLVSVGVFAFLFMYRVNFEFLRFFEKSTEQLEKFSNPKVTPVWDMIVSWFFGGNMLFSSFILRDYHNKKGFEYKALFMEGYTGVFPYIFVGIVLFLVVWSYAKNFKNKLVQVLMLSFLVDIVIHCVLKFGLHTSYIYGGHFIFIVPLMIGWLFFAYRHSAKIISILFVVIWILFAYLAFNNVYRMTEFFQFLELYYR